MCTYLKQRRKCILCGKIANHKTMVNDRWITLTRGSQLIVRHPGYSRNVNIGMNVGKTYSNDRRVAFDFCSASCVAKCLKEMQK